MNYFKNIFGKPKKLEASNNNRPLSAQSVKPKTVLVVEDEELLANAIEVKCKLAGLSVLKAFNGQTGLDLAIVNKPDIILLDLLMPVMDGETMLRKLRDIPEFKHLPVIILTNSAEADNYRKTALYDSAGAFMIKSNVNPDDIIKKIQELI